MREIVEAPEPKPILVSRFGDIRKKPEINPTIGNFSDIFSDEQYRQHSFEEAKKSFEFIFDKKKVVYHLNQEPNEESFSYLKLVRRYGLVLGDIYRFVNSSHMRAEKLHQFLGFLGKYNDSYWVSVSNEAKQGVIDNLDDIEFPINFASTPEFKEYTTRILSDVKMFLGERVLSIDRFHALRKRFRSLADFLQIAAAEDYGGNLHYLFYSVIELSSEMGKQHDDLVERKLRGEIDYEKSTLEVNPHIVSEFARIEPFIKRVCGLM